jgi:hypothetical protein
MFWRRFARRTSSSPEQIEKERADRAQLKTRIIALFNAQPDAQLTIKLLEQKLAPTNLAALAIALAELQSEGVLDRIIRVESPESHGGIKDFNSPDEVPDEIFDWRTQQTIPVEPSITQFVFKAHAGHDLEHANV